MPIELVEVRALEGPNIYHRQPAVMLAVSAERDLGADLTRLVKEWGQALGLTVGYLRAAATPLDGGRVLTQLSFTCSLVTIGAAMAPHIVEDLRAAERQDEDYSHDEELFTLLRRRQREDPPLALLQLQAEALARQVPLFKRPDGRLQLGYGARGWAFDPAGLSVGMTIAPPWDQIGRVPLLALGGSDSAQVAGELATLLRQQERQVGLGQGGVEQARAALAEQDAQLLILALSPQAILERGLPFDRCAIAAVGALAGLDQPEDMAAGLPALTTQRTGRTILLADDLRTRDLAARTLAPVILLSEQGLTTELAGHLTSGGQALWRAGETVVLGQGERRSELAGAGRTSLMALAVVEALASMELT